LAFLASLRHAGLSAIPSAFFSPARVHPRRPPEMCRRPRGSGMRRTIPGGTSVHRLGPFAIIAAKPHKPAFLPAAHLVPPHRQEEKKKEDETRDSHHHHHASTPRTFPHPPSITLTCTHTNADCMLVHITVSPTTGKSQKNKYVARPRRIIPTHAGMHIHASVRRRRLVSSTYLHRMEFGAM
jgi:hypothetical protein